MNIGQLKDDGKGQVSYKQPDKKTIYVKSSSQLSKEIYNRLNANLGSFENLENLFEKLNQALTTRLNQPIDGTPVDDVEVVPFKDVYFLIYTKLRDQDSVSILTDEALALFFDATTKVHKVNTADKNNPVNSGAMEMKAKDEQLDSLLASLTNASKQGG